MPAAGAKADRTMCFQQVLDAWVSASRLFNSRAVVQWYRERADSPFNDAAERSMLAEIVGSGPIRLSDLADAQSRSASNTSKMVQSLVAAGLVKRTIPEHDRRVTLLEPTEAGLALHHRIAALDLKLLDRHFATFTDDEVKTFAELMQRFLERVASWHEAGLDLEAK